MAAQSTILTEIKGPVAQIFLNRPERHNALDRSMIQALLLQLEALEDNHDIRIIALRGKGKSFCAGADLNWMQSAPQLSPEENFHECRMLAKCLYMLHMSEKITVAFVHGNSYGGALGFVAACDLAVASAGAVLAFSEVRLGLVPATIMPYVIRKTGNRGLDKMLTGRSFKPSEAEFMGLVNAVVQDDAFDVAIEDTLTILLQTAPEAQRSIKLQAQTLLMPAITEEMMNHTAGLLAETRISKEALEGLGAFTEKRKPAWLQV